MNNFSTFSALRNDELLVVDGGWSVPQNLGGVAMGVGQAMVGAGMVVGSMKTAAVSAAAIPVTKGVSVAGVAASIGGISTGVNWFNAGAQNAANAWHGW